MTEVFTNGAWTPKEGHEEAFVEAWTDFARWATAQPGSGTIRLTRDLSDPQRFVSFANWGSFEQMRAWKASDEFRPRMSRVQEHVAEFSPTELEVVVELSAQEAVSD
jgi:heme-degrading monooxygenase HmoA